MAVENIPWMIQGGLHSAAAGRRVLFKANGGAEGVSGINDMKVTQFAVATGAVSVLAGGCTMVSRYPGVKGESYDGQVLTDTGVSIAANGGGSTRYDLVIARIDDWNFPGQQAVPAALPTDATPAFKLAVIQGVAADVKTAKELNLNYPAIALARIAIPAGTSAITQAMITDLRAIPRPRRERRLVAIQPTTAYEVLNSAGVNTFVNWPAEAQASVDIPEWATRAVLVGDISGAFIGVGNAYGYIRAVLAGQATPGTYYDVHGEAADGWTRTGLKAGATVDIPAEMRGTTQAVWMQGSKAPATTAPLQSDGAAFVSFDIEFLEVASAV